MKYRHLILLATASFVFAAPTFAQRSHPGGGPPPGRGPGSASGSNASVSESNRNAGMTGTNMSHASPADVLSHNKVIGDKIAALTGEPAGTACNGFKSLGQCVAAAHVAKNLKIPGGFDALKAKITGSGSVSLGKAIQTLAPDADAKAEAKKANKQASDDMKEASS
jgi:hypothetical protein